MRYLTFAQQFPCHHPRKGEDTNFSFKILKPFATRHVTLQKYVAKTTTIREGSRWKVGDCFMAKYWEGKPYNSNQAFLLLSPLKIKKIWKFEITKKGNYKLNGKKIDLKKRKQIALNEGFEDVNDFELWFQKKSFKGQLITWSDDINY